MNQKRNSTIYAVSGKETDMLMPHKNIRQRPVKKKPLKHPEFDIQKECVEWFRKNYRNAVIFAVPNEGCVQRMNHFRQLGLLRGVSDVVVLLPTRIIFIEFKSETGTQSRFQKGFQNKVERMGYEYHICRSLADFKTLLRNE